MLSRFAIAFIALSSAVAIAACSSYSSSTVGGNGTGPNFPSQTLYATNSNQNAISIYGNGQKSGSGPSYQIGGSNTQLNGPQYLAFDSSRNLWVTNYSSSTNGAKLVEIAALATGNVVPLGTTPVAGRVRGIAITPKATATPSPAAMRGPRAASPSPSSSPTQAPELMIISDVNPTAVYPSQLLLFLEGTTQPYQSIAGPNPNLNVPGGVALDSHDNIYVTNVQGHSVDKFILPTPSPTPKPTPTPTATPSPTPSPSTSPSTTPSPTPSPTATPYNITPTFTIASSLTTHVNTPTSVAVDSAGNVYVSDQGAPGASCRSISHAAAILVFAKSTLHRGVIFPRPQRIISGCNTKLLAPTDVKVDASGIIYVADTTAGGSGIIYVFGSGSKGNVKPTSTYSSPGAVTGLGIVP